MAAIEDRDGVRMSRTGNPDVESAGTIAAHSGHTTRAGSEGQRAEVEQGELQTFFVDGAESPFLEGQSVPWPSPEF